MKQFKWWYAYGVALLLSYLLLKKITYVPKADMKYLEFESFVKRGRVQSVKIQSVTKHMGKQYIAHVEVRMGKDDQLTTRYLPVHNPDNFIAALPKSVKVNMFHTKIMHDFFSENSEILSDLASTMLHLWLLFGVLRFMKSGGFDQFTNLMELGKSKAKKFNGEMMDIRFKHVAGCEGAK